MNDQIKRDSCQDTPKTEDAWRIGTPRVPIKYFPLFIAAAAAPGLFISVTQLTRIADSFTGDVTSFVLLMGPAVLFATMFALAAYCSIVVTLIMHSHKIRKLSVFELLFYPFPVAVVSILVVFTAGNFSSLGIY